ncbi:MAG TPA: CBS domain-containing protein [Xanthobacteraceae bacterium]|nr:CBS domain-containing protein [Xanthobacteraceae bacterium]
MKARDVMVSPVITVEPSASVKEVAQILLQHHISALPVVDGAGQLIGIVSESDLMRRADLGTERHRSRWLSALFVDEERLAAEYVKAHGHKVADVMTKRVITAAPDTPLNDIASLLEKHGIKRVPILENGTLVGIVSRANLIQALAADRKGLKVPVPDSQLRDRIMSHLNAQPWAHTSLINVTVNDGIVDLWGLTLSKEEKQALRVAAESIPGVRAVNDNVIMQNLQAAY